MTYKIDTCRLLARCFTLLGYGIIRMGTGWLSLRMMWLSGIWGHGADSLASQWGSTIRSPWVRTVTSRYLSCYDLICCQDLKLQQPTNSPFLGTPSAKVGSAKYQFGLSSWFDPTGVADHTGVLVCFVVVLCHCNSILVLTWHWYDAWDEEQKAQAYTFTDSRDL